MKLNTSLVFLSAALFACAPASAFELKHSEGTLSLDSAPKKVVSFDVGVLDSLAALDVPVAGVARSMYEGDLARYQNTREA
ncbi:MAG: iron compound ABC transporter substrate-binding protein, partial [Alcaligenaceae bacterium]|nr:iron compound ABC transporter substrate-binding protein [Alcaligenaceae bacterium]